MGTYMICIVSTQFYDVTNGFFCCLDHMMRGSVLWTWRKLREEQDRLDEERGGGYDYDICGDFPIARHKKEYTYFGTF